MYFLNPFYIKKKFGPSKIGGPMPWAWMLLLWAGPGWLLGCLAMIEI